MLSEEDLATKLKKQCHSNGEEIIPKESSKTLHQLGLVYKEKSPDKISLIQSVALMTSAVLRQPDNVDNVTKDLDDVSTHIMTLADAKNPDREFVSKAVAETKKEIEQFRKNTKDKLAKLKAISDDVKGDELHAIRKKRVGEVREVQDYVTETYKDIMGHIAEHTVNIMGEPPCKFALVGMGSLAKGEVTPYSDFESVIVLEDEIQNHNEYTFTLEYCRWFATVFQMILVRLGETLLRFLAIPCLNNPLNENEDWFYDAYTPCGICPDGFAPQASKNPLGKQTKTQKKPWTTELIKPVSEMVEYLDTEEDLKNGYHLADMLTKTCFVYGDSGVFEDFEKQVKQKLNQMPIFSQRIQQNIQDDYKQYDVQAFALDLAVDIKRLVLRSCSLFIAPLGHLYKCKDLNCFRILDELQDRGTIDATLCGKLKFSLAVGCEMRLRWYSKTSGQNDILHQGIATNSPSCVAQVLVDIGTRAIIDGLSIIIPLQEYVVKCFHDKQLKPIGFVESHIHAVNFASQLKLDEFAIKLIDECIDLDECKNELDQLKLHNMLGMSLFNLQRYEECVRISEVALKRCNGFNYIGMICRINYMWARSLEALGKEEQALNLYHTNNVYFSTVSGTSVSRPLMFKCTGDYFLKIKEYEEAGNYFEVAYNILKENLGHRKDPSTYFKLMVSHIMCLIARRQIDTAVKMSEELMYERLRLHVDKETDFYLTLVFRIMGICLRTLNRYEEALAYLDKAGKFHNSECFFSKVECLTKLGRLLEAESLLKDFWDKNKPDFFAFNLNRPILLNKYSEFCTYTYCRIALYHHVFGQPKEGMLFAKKGFHLSCQLNGQDLPTDAAWMLVTTFFDLQRYEECLAAAKHGIKLFQFVSKDCWAEEKFVDIVRTFALCQIQLGMGRTLPYKCTPSIFFYVMKSPKTLNLSLI